ncbi:MAG: hypothetical protein K1Y36_07145 [Blastocatellia bacterium]|nr:hypothetical protein [Blastocatellia bacterium]
MILYEINARLNGRTFDEYTTAYLNSLKALHFDVIWLMGVWEISPQALLQSKQYAPDFEGSPYAIFRYEFNPILGNRAAFRRLCERAHGAGLKVVVDFVPNHLALDAPLIDEHPDFVMHSAPKLRHETETDYYTHPSGLRLAHGKDPYFPGWNDTVQLDYSNPGLRAYMRKVLEDIAACADGVRCDMAMLVLREQVKHQWYPNLPSRTFDKRMPREFWDRAITAARNVNPDFLFIAEAYWDTEPKLRNLGFDYTYHKRLYDALLSDKPFQRTRHHLAHATNAFLQHSVHFMENHDEDRLAARLAPLAARRAVFLSGLLPGMLLIHQGQMEGITEKVPVQRVKFVKRHKVDKELRVFYADMLKTVAHSLFRQGSWLAADSNCPEIVCFWRHYRNQYALILAPVGEAAVHLPERIQITLPTPLLESPGVQISSGWRSYPLTQVKITEAGLLLRRDEVTACLNAQGIGLITFTSLR